MPKRILFVDQYGHLGGAQRVLLDLIRGLTGNHHFAAVALHGSGEFQEKLINAKVPVLPLPLGDYRSGRKTPVDFARFLFNTLRCARLLSLFARHQQADLIYANGPRTFAAAVLAGWMSRRPVVWHLHNVFHEGAELQLLCHLGKYTERIVACSEAVTKSIIQRNPLLKSRIRVVYSGIPSWIGERDPFISGNPPELLALPADALVFGILGRVTPNKGQHIFLEAAALILREFPKVRFLIVGSPAPNDRLDLAYSEGLHRSARSLGVEKTVHFIAHKENLRGIYALLDVVVMASTIAEALPQTVLEAMALEKAIIAPASGGLLEMLENDVTGILIEKLHPEALAAGMRTLICDPCRRSALAVCARQQAFERFSQERFLDEIKEVLKSLP